MQRLLIALAALCAALAFALSPRAAAAQYAVGVPYQGELSDASMIPLSGVFGLRFVLFESADSMTPIWSEEAWVAVAVGRYDVALGRVSPIPATLDGRELWLEVQTRDGSVITRHPIEIFYRRLDGQETSATIRYTAFADLAGVALNTDRAARAEECTRLEGRTLSQIDRNADIERRLAEMQDMLTATTSRIGTETTTLPAFGGSDSGNSYEVLCPPGFAMTGARGGNGQLVDSLQPICTRLE